MDVVEVWSWLERWISGSPLRNRRKRTTLHFDWDTGHRVVLVQISSAIPKAVRGVATERTFSTDNTAAAAATNDSGARERACARWLAARSKVSTAVVDAATIGHHRTGYTTNLAPTFHISFCGPCASRVHHFRTRRHDRTRTPSARNLRVDPAIVHTCRASADHAGTRSGGIFSIRPSCMIMPQPGRKRVAGSSGRTARQRPQQGV